MPKKFLRWDLVLKIGVVIFVVTMATAGWQVLHLTPADRHIDAGVKFLQDGQNAAAENQWRQAVRLEPKNARAWEFLGDYYLAANSWQAAREALEHVRQIAPDIENLNGRLAVANWRLKKSKPAQEYAQAQLRQDTNNIQMLQILADIANKLSHKEDELKYLQRLAQLEPQNVEVLTSLARAWTQSYEFDKAQPLIERILQLNPNSDYAYTMRGMALYNQNPTPARLLQAEAAFKKVLELNPQDSEAHRSLGRIYMRMNQPRLAIEEFESLGRGRPYASAHFLELAAAYRKIGDTKRADDLQQRFTELKKVNAQMQDLKEFLLREPQDFETNLKLGALLVETVAAGGDGYELYHFRYVTKDLKGCDFYLQQARALHSQNPLLQSALQNLERVYTQYLGAGMKALKSGQLASADRQFSRAVILRSDDARTRNALQQAFQASLKATPKPTPSASQPSASQPGDLLRGDLLRAPTTAFPALGR